MGSLQTQGTKNNTSTKHQTSLHMLTFYQPRQENPSTFIEKLLEHLNRTITSSNIGFGAPVDARHGSCNCRSHGHPSPWHHQQHVLVSPSTAAIWVVDFPMDPAWIGWMDFVLDQFAYPSWAVGG